MLVKEQTAFAIEMSEERLPRAAARARRDALARGERNEDAVHAKSRLERLEEVLVGAAPELREDQQVGVETDDVVEDPGRSTPSVDTSVKVERRDTHNETLGRPAFACGRLYTWTLSMLRLDTDSGGSMPSPATPNGVIPLSLYSSNVRCPTTSCSRSLSN
jgi:hypothetical protein